MILAAILWPVEHLPCHRRLGVEQGELVCLHETEVEE